MLPVEQPNATLQRSSRIAVVIPCYRVTRTIEDVIARIGPWAAAIYCVDDACPDDSGGAIEQRCTDPRIRVIRRPVNGGVGAATIDGYRAALAEGADILAKVDGDGQMDPALVPALIRPIIEGYADYVKGNRFFSAETVARMPWLRLIGNAGLSFMTKLSSGYWDLFDPTNGFTALEARVARELPWEKLHQRYFFESDMLFRLSILRARVVELPAMAIYRDEKSNLSELRALLTFPVLHARNLAKRIAYNYFLRNFSAASLTGVTGLALMSFGVFFGGARWALGSLNGTPNTAGTVMLAALPTLLGIQFLLNFLSHDISMTPSAALHHRLSRVRLMTPEK